MDPSTSTRSPDAPAPVPHVGKRRVITVLFADVVAFWPSFADLVLRGDP